MQHVVDGPMPPTRTVQVWRCDVCRVRTFDSFEAACAHEEDCRTMTDQYRSSKDVEPTPSSTQESVTSTEQSAAVQIIDIISSPEVVEVTKDRNQPAARRKQQKQTSIFGGKKPHSDATTTSRPPRSNGTTVKPSKESKQLAIQRKKSTKTSSSSYDSTVPLMFQGLDQKKLMAEQATVEFRAKRLLQQKRDRERAEKRQQLQEQRTVPSKADALGLGPTWPRRDESQGWAPRFPVPSHVIPDGSTRPDQAARSKGSSYLESRDVNPWWARRNDGRRLSIVEANGKEPAYALLPPKNSVYAKQPPLLDHLQLVLDATLVPPTETRTKTRTWADVYFNDRLIIDGFVPEHLKDAANEMIAFVQGWMTQRQHAHDRAAERHRRLQGHHHAQRRIKKVKRTVADAQDDDWCDSDEEADENGLKNLCHITGPSGLGKSALVYAVAKFCGCQVIELNPSDKRGAAAVRKTIEEATQSHSSIDLLKKQEKATMLHEGLDDSDQESDPRNGRSSAVSVILIDEVDNIEASETSGFWSTLSDLSKRAKCPIVLTSNALPEESKVISRRCGVLPVQRARPDDCIEYIRAIVDGEGFTWRDNDSRTSKAGLSMIAELCNSDMRRIAHEMQLFASHQPSQQNMYKLSMEAARCGSEPVADTDCRPRIEGVQPRCIRHDESELLTITGTGFLKLASPTCCDDGGYFVDVFVGDRQCPVARIIDDTTILAVNAPVKLQSHYRRFHRYHDEEYPAIRICSVSKTGVVSSWPGCPQTVETLRGDAILQNETPVLLQRHFSTVVEKETESDSDSDEETEFDELKTTVASSSIVERVQDLDIDECVRLLMTRLKAWKGELPKTFNSTPPVKNLDVFASMCSSAEVVSDAAILDDVALTGRPYLSGPCYGFGFDLTCSSGIANQNAKPPSFERLFSSSWNEDCYFFGGVDCFMNFPFTARENNLLKQTESSLRGLSHHLLTANDSCDEEQGKLDQLEKPTVLRLAEDAFLCLPPPNSLLSLPFYLRNSASPGTFELKNMVRNEVFYRKRTAKVEQEVDLLDEYIFPSIHPATISRFHRGLSREIDQLLVATELADPILYQETLPMLRVMSIHAANKKMISEKLKDENSASLTSKRRTRNSSGEQHCLERISHVFRKSDAAALTCWEVGECLGESSLLWA